MAWKGGCFCGKVRYRAEGEPLRVMHCHCTICRRVSAAPVVTWINFPVERVTWTKSSRACLKSTPPAFCFFCPTCGTHIVFEIDGARELDITVNSLDRPADATSGYSIFAHTYPDSIS